MRRSQTERRAKSARMIIKATIRCLYSKGYGATTVEAVLKESGVSRGRLLHHFPMRTDLMVAVGHYVWELDRRYMRRWSRQYDKPRDQLLNSVDLAWTMMSRSTGMAVLEILVASRSDAELSALFVPEHARIQAEADRFVQQMVDAAGLTSRVNGRDLHHFIESCVRGLAIDQVFTGQHQQAPAALRLAQNAVDILLAKD
jgi:AcrR family transcriptional regulator